MIDSKMPIFHVAMITYNKLDNMFGPVASFSGIVFVAVGIFLLISLHFTGIFLIISGIFLKFSTNSAIIDHEKKTYQVFK